MHPQEKNCTAIDAECTHEVQFRGMCAVCFKDLTIITSGGAAAPKATISMTHDSLGVFVSEKTAEKLERETAQRLKREQKLSLILDLDQTLIHATIDQTVGEWLADDGSNLDYPELKDVHKFTLPESPIIYYIKLRPGTLEFLAKASKLYEMHIYTMGTRAYADAVAKIIDPTGHLFIDRILSRDTSGSFQEKRIGRIFPGEGEKMAVVVDDRGDVWNWCKNLIRIKPYIDDFFVGIGDINAPGVVPIVLNPQLSLLPQSAEEPQAVTPPSLKSSSQLKRRPIMHDNDSELSDIMSRLEKIHESFYNKLKRRGGDGSDYISSEVDADVRRVMDVIRSRVLAGCELVFSAVVPLGFDIKRHEAYRFAIMFGAKVADEVTESTTHVIAAKLGTDKVMKGFRTNGVSIVSPDWLYRVAFAWRRLPEAPYALPRPTIPKDANSDVNYAAPASNSATDFDESTEEVFVNIDGIDWGDMDAEVDEAMNESDDDVEDLNTDQTVETEFDGGIGGVGGEIEEDEGAEDWDTLEGEIEGYLDADSHADESGSEASIEFTNRKRKRRATESPKSSPKK